MLAGLLGKVGVLPRFRFALHSQTFHIALCAQIFPSPRKNTAQNEVSCPRFVEVAKHTTKPIKLSSQNNQTIKSKHTTKSNKQTNKTKTKPKQTTKQTNS